MGDSMPRTFVVMQFNDAYLRFGLTLLRSLERYAKNAIKIAYTVNLSNEDVAALKKSLSFFSHYQFHCAVFAGKASPKLHGKSQGKCF